MSNSTNFYNVNTNGNTGNNNNATNTNGVCPGFPMIPVTLFRAKYKKIIEKEFMTFHFYKNGKFYILVI